MVASCNLGVEWGVVSTRLFFSGSYAAERRGGIMLGVESCTPRGYGWCCYCCYCCCSHFGHNIDHCCDYMQGKLV